jgi:hypothetical protein
MAELTPLHARSGTIATDRRWRHHSVACHIVYFLCSIDGFRPSFIVCALFTIYVAWLERAEVPFPALAASQAENDVAP